MFLTSPPAEGGSVGMDQVSVAKAHGHVHIKRCLGYLLKIEWLVLIKSRRLGFPQTLLPVIEG
jgi:hypothetical protein